MALEAFVRCVRTFGVYCDCLLAVVAISGFWANLNFDFKWPCGDAVCSCQFSPRNHT
jgi:hypothetical protein